MSRIRLVPVIFILVISLGILFAGWQAYQRFNLVNPLKSDLQKVQGVQSVQVDSGSSNTISIQLAAVKDLQTTYAEISNTVSGSLGGSEQVKLLDNKGEELTRTWEDLNLVVFEGIAKGNYTEMVSSVEQTAKKQNIDARITMDEHHVYIQMAKGSHDLYKVIDITLHQGGASS
jgi:hypothetical protein